MNKKYLLQSMVLAKHFKGVCSPNPPVGAIVVKNDHILGQGYHQGCGTDHAEVVALRGLTPDDCAEATLYVTLEPCCHHGRTPPCTDKIIAMGIKRVIYGYGDPNPVVSGRGAEKLRAAGVECELIALPEIAEFYQSYHYWHQTKKPVVTAKLALSLDGKIAGPNSQPFPITGQELQIKTHFLRKESDAILTTAATICQDDPQLNVRLCVRNPVAKPIFILDSQLKVPVTAKVFTTASSITLFHAPSVAEEKIQQLTAAGARCIPVPLTKSGLDLAMVLEIIGELGIHDLWVEAGGQLCRNMLAQKLINKLYLYFGMVWLGSAALSAFTDCVPRLDEAKSYHWSGFGRDACCEITWPLEE